MSPLTDNYARPSWGPQEDRRRVPVEEDAILWVGAIVEANAAGYAIAGTGAAENIFLGIKIRQANGVDAGEWETDNTGGDDGAVYAWVCCEGVWQFPKSGTFTQADIGCKVKAADSGTVAKNLATFTTTMTGANNDFVATAKKAYSGEIGNNISIELIDPAGNDKALRIEVVGLHIRAYLATGGAGAITTTAALLKAAIEAHTLANAMVSIAYSGADTGAGAVTALAPVNLTGAGPTVGVVEELIGSELKINTKGFAGRRAA